MIKNKNIVISEENFKEITGLFVDAIQDIKGKKIKIIDLTTIDERPTGYFIICNGDSKVQAGAIATNVKNRIKAELGWSIDHLEGMDNKEWILLDYLNIVVHVFYKETRDFYQLDALWSDAKTIQIEDLD